MSHTLINYSCKIDLVSLYLSLLWWQSILKGSVDQKHAKTNKIWRQNSKIHSAFACSWWPPWFPDCCKLYRACVKCGSRKHMFGVSPFHLSWQSNISILSKERFKYTFPWENTISHMPSLFLQFPIIPINFRVSFLQTFNYWELLGILKNSHWCFHLFLSIPKYSKVFYVSSFVCLGINWNS